MLGLRGTHPTLCCPYLGSLDIPVQQNDVMISNIQHCDVSNVQCSDISNVQQGDTTEEFYMTIVNGSLENAYQKYGSSYPGIPKSKSNKSVIIVGAGLSGLSAAFELEKVGYKVQIVELQHRVGGRTKTLRDGFLDGLQAEGGAMRIPPNHFLTHGYIKQFGVDLRPFINFNGDTWLYLTGEKKIRTKDWTDNNRFYSDKFFPGWDANIPSKSNVDGLLDLHEKTMEPVSDDLFHKISQSHKISQNGAQDGWAAWVEKWSKLSVNDFLRSNLNEYLPWPEVAIRGYQIATYSPEFDMSLVEYLRDDLGGWWRKKLETPVDGMDTLAKHFIKPHDYEENKIYLAPNITFGTKVYKITKIGKNEVEVKGRNTFTGKETTFTAGAVIVTVPLTILRQIDIDLSKDYKRAIGNNHYGASTKIALQCRSRFWEKPVAEGGVGQGGFSKTDLPIGQFHYPSPDNPPSPNGRGILVCYMWGQDALILGSQSEAEAIDSAVREVTKIHPEMETEFEVGMVQAWFNDPASQGAYALLRPYQYNSSMKTLMTPDHPIYLAGEAISYTNAWIQGALESGLNAAFHLYSYNHEDN